MFIGRDLDKAALIDGFQSCRVTGEAIPGCSPGLVLQWALYFPIRAAKMCWLTFPNP